VHPGFAQDAEETEADLVREQRLQKAKIQSIAEATATSAVDLDMGNKLKEEASLFDERIQKQMLETLAQAKLWEKKTEDVKKMIEEGSKGKAAEKLFKKFPKLLDAATDVLRDKEAMPKLIEVLSKKEKLKQYFIIWLTLMVGAWLIKKYLFPPEPNFMRRLFTSLMFSTGVSCISLGVFYIFFSDELAPLLRILLRHFA
jgi:hypothetical protein